MIDLKSLIYSIAAVSAAALLASCEPDNPEPEPVDPTPEPVTLDLSFTLPANSAKSAWTAGDQIVVHGEYAAQQVTVTLDAADIAADGKTARKTVDGLFPYEREDCNSNLYAAYPASAVDNLTHCFFYSKFNTTNATILAACNSGNSFVFEDICSYVTFKVTGNYEELVFAGNKKATLGYEFLQVKITDTESNLLQYKGDPVQSIMTAFTSGATTVCIPGDVALEKGFSIKLRKGGKAVKAYIENDPVTLQRGKVLDLGDITSKFEDYDDPLSDDILSLDAEGGANCYIVSAPGAYKFKAMKGNSKEDIGEAASAEVLWETWNTAEEPDAGSVVASAAFSDDYIIIHMPETLHAGNAVVAARDEAGTILWSWHIWVPGSEITTDSYGGIMGAPLMSRNLGALADTKADGMVDPLSYGLVYQWGRKDPFVNSPTAMKNDLAAWTGAEEEVADGQISLEEAIANPRLLGHINNGNWMYVADESLWTDEEKTIYDPCPPGYRVPARDSGKPFWSSDDSAQAGWSVDGANGWLTIGEPAAVFPIAGYRDDYSVDGMAKVGSRTLYWTARGSDQKGYGADLRYDKGTYAGSGSAPKARLGSVRCVLENAE